MFLTKSASASVLREAERARNNRLEIIQALSHGQVSRRDLIKWGIFTSGGFLAAKHGLSPFVRNSWGAIPTGVPASPLFGALPFTFPMLRFDVLPRLPVSALSPAPTKEANTTQQPVPAILGGGTGPIEGRPPGPIWAHQGWERFPPKVAIEVTQAPCRIGAKGSYRPEVSSPSLNCDFDDVNAECRPYFNTAFPNQDGNRFWTFNGTVPPKLVQGRYGEPILFRHHNGLSADRRDNAGFGLHTISTHEHNGHHGAENDGFTGAYFFPGQFYDYHWPIVLAGFSTINTGATDPKAGSPNDSGGVDLIPGDWHETMSTHWFHDHMFSFTSQNVYKGVAAMFNIYSALDRGNEAINDGVNLRLPSGSAKSWGNLDYDVNIMLADKAWNADGQMQFDIFDLDGFLGDQMTVNLAWKPFFNVEPRKYRFRILNASVSRFFKLALSDGSPMIQIANDGNLLPGPVVLTELDEIGIAERYDIVIDFSRYALGSTVHLVNLAEHQDGRRVAKDLRLSEALSGNSPDPCVGRFLEFRIKVPLAGPDRSQVPNVMIPNPDLSKIPVSRERVFEFGRGANKNTNDPISSAFGPWGVKVDGQDMLAADFGRISAAPKFGTREVWTLRNGGGGWDHPIHIHFEEGQVLDRDGSASKVPAWERGRKDVYRLRPGGSIKITMQFRDWGGMFMEHCHNTVHEDNAMLLRWEIHDAGAPFLKALPTPIPTPQGVTFRDPTQVLRNA
ncbi:MULTISPECIES: multicopper oxidase family protein [Ramlibacter]|uniref:Multicopper oxidase domain-containing protein n=1 Tax=Ramlibacter pinisoli TaxID=2682844 RepID=A0A6N8IQW4_9BURK|nr:MULTISPECIES: multicopper oxidase domain-containing protein [Ramlibacter]MBA2964238.1 multicopper oxidase domain-containing protein [Ramlibacter sp. CGMCC 1.13660]MVQ29204.1 multicopper oxidase domain-containing protein [Ramlibacter pinisoli]